jgi:hypothetical protein
MALVAILLALLVAAPARMARAAATVVGNGSPASCTEQALRNAIAAGGLVTFDCGPAPYTIMLTSELTVRHDTEIDGGGAEIGGRITLSGGRQTSVIGAVPHVALTLRNLTIRDGYNSTWGSHAGGVGTGHNCVLTIINSRFVNNDGTGGRSERGGGAVKVHNATTVIVRDSEFIGNHGMNGGAFNILGSSLSVDNATFVDNDALAGATGALSGGGEAGLGGAIYIDGASDPPNNGIGGQITIRSSIFSGNQAGKQGGAIFGYLYPPDSMTIDNATFVENAARNRTGQGAIGGALRFGNGKLTINNSTFAGNIAEGDGGAIWAGAADAIFSNLTMSGNRAEPAPGINSKGGAMWITEGAYQISNSTIADNYAYWSGGAMIATGTQIHNSIIANNITAIVNDDTRYARQCQGQISGSNNLQWPDLAQDSSACGTGVRAADAHIEPLGANGGPSPTRALQGESPAINAGDPLRCPATDQRGADRVGQCDIGAFEYGAQAPTALVPAVPALAQIANDGSPLVRLDWGHVSRTIHYEVDLQGVTPAGAAYPMLTTPDITTMIAVEPGAYSARIRACNFNGCGEWSAVQSFTVTRAPARVFLPAVALH